MDLRRPLATVTLAAEYIIGLATLSQTLLTRVENRLESWQCPPVYAAVFGSATRGSMAEDSDIDILLIRLKGLLWPVNERGWSGNCGRPDDELHTQECDAHVRRGRVKVAQQYMDTADLIENEVPNAFVGNCVLAGVAAADVICCSVLGEHARSGKRDEAVVLLKQADAEAAKYRLVVESGVVRGCVFGGGG